MSEKKKGRKVGLVNLCVAVCFMKLGNIYVRGWDGGGCWEWGVWIWMMGCGWMMGSGMRLENGFGEEMN